MEGAGADRRDLAVAHVWSAKESALKALRQGLRLDTREVEVELSCSARGGWQPQQVRHATRTFEGWWRRDCSHELTAVPEPADAPPRLSV